MNQAVGADSSEGPCAHGAQVEVGNGERAHVPLADGAEVVMVHGPQGGWHVWFSVEVYDFGSLASLHYTVDDLDLGTRLTALDYATKLAPATDVACGKSAWGLFGYLPGDDTETERDESPPAYLAGHTVRMAMSVTDIENPETQGTDSASVTLVCDPADLPTYPGCQ